MVTESVETDLGVDGEAIQQDLGATVYVYAGSNRWRRRIVKSGLVEAHPGAEIARHWCARPFQSRHADRQTTDARDVRGIARVWCVRWNDLEAGCARLRFGSVRCPRTESPVFQRPSSWPRRSS